MNKSDLVDGWLLQRRDGEIFVKIGNNLHSWETKISLDCYQESLLHNDVENKDIVQVGESKNASYIAKVCMTDNIEWKWERRCFEITKSEQQLLKNLQDFGVTKVSRFADQDRLNLYDKSYLGHIHLNNYEFADLVLGYSYKIADILEDIK